MSLLDQAVADFAEIVGDTGAEGFGKTLTFTSPGDVSKPIAGFGNDIAQLIDLETGASITGRSVSVSVPMSALIAAGFSTLPVGVADGSGKPWRVSFVDAIGATHMFRVERSHPDRTLGALVCELEVYSA